MGKTAHQKELLAQYKERSVVGGICLVRCGGSGKAVLLPASDPGSQRSRFTFAAATNSPFLPALAADWQAFGAEDFTFEVLEELERSPAQSEQEFKADLDILAALWRDRLAGEGSIFY